MNQSPSTPPEFLAYLQEWECMTALQKYCFKNSTPDKFHLRQYRSRFLNPTNSVLEKMVGTVQDTSTRPPQDLATNHTVQCFDCYYLGHISCDFSYLRRPVKCSYCDSDQHTRVRCPQAANRLKSSPTEVSRANLQAILFHSIPL